jgi:integrating conjugative element protein (TIGR03757 family)
MKSMWREVSPVRRRSTIGLALLFTARLCAADTAASVWVFTTEQLPPIKRLDMANQVFVLDDIDKPLKALSFQYPGSDDKARQRANAVLNSPQGKTLLDQIQRNAKSVAIAWQSGIAKLPAVLIDKRYVVYGEYNVQVALDRVERHRHAR